MIWNKWYVEFSLVLLLIAATIVFILNFDFTSAPKATTTTIIADKSTTPEKPNPEKEKWLAGKELFRASCASCHNPKSDGVGPALVGVTARWNAAGSFKGKTGQQWMHLWIKNWHDVVNAGYKYGIDLKNSRPAEMNVFGGYLTDEKIDNIIFYVDSPDRFKRVVAP